MLHLASCCEPSLSLLFQTSGRIDPEKINMPLDDFKCGCFPPLWGYKGTSITAVSCLSLTDAEPLNCMIKGCHSKEHESNRDTSFHQAADSDCIFIKMACIMYQMFKQSGLFLFVFTSEEVSPRSDITQQYQPTGWFSLVL